MRLIAKKSLWIGSAMAILATLPSQGSAASKRNRVHAARSASPTQQPQSEPTGWDIASVCAYFFGFDRFAGQSFEQLPKLQVDPVSGAPRLDLGSSCADLSKTLNNALKKAQQACINAVFVAQRHDVQNQKSIAYRKFGNCESPEVAAGLAALQPLLGNGSGTSDYLNVLNNGGFVDMTTREAEKSLFVSARELGALIHEPTRHSQHSASCEEAYLAKAMGISSVLQRALDLLVQNLKSYSSRSGHSNGINWSKVDALGGEATMSDAEATKYAQNLYQGQNAADRKIGEMLLAAQDPRFMTRAISKPQRKAYARILQSAIADFHSSGALSGEFEVDGDVHKRTISNIRRLLEPQYREQFFQKLCTSLTVAEFNCKTDSPQKDAFSPPAKASSGGTAVAPRSQDKLSRELSQYENPDNHHDPRLKPVSVQYIGAQKAVTCMAISSATHEVGQYLFTEEFLKAHYQGYCPAQPISNDEINQSNTDIQLALQLENGM